MYVPHFFFNNFRVFCIEYSVFWYTYLKVCVAKNAGFKESIYFYLGISLLKKMCGNIKSKPRFYAWYRFMPRIFYFEVILLWY